MRARLAVFAVIVVLVAAWRFPTFRAVVWGATWGNNMAGLEWSIGGGFLAWLGRDHIGAKLAAWWAKHFGPHNIEHHKQALREHEEAKASGQDNG